MSEKGRRLQALFVHYNWKLNVFLSKVCFMWIVTKIAT